MQRVKLGGCFGSRAPEQACEEQLLHRKKCIQSSPASPTGQIVYLKKIEDTAASLRTSIATLTY